MQHIHRVASAIAVTAHPAHVFHRTWRGMPACSCYTAHHLHVYMLYIGLPKKYPTLRATKARFCLDVAYTLSCGKYVPVEVEIRVLGLPDLENGARVKCGVWRSIVAVIS